MFSNGDTEKQLPEGAEVQENNAKTVQTCSKHQVENITKYLIELSQKISCDEPKLAALLLLDQICGQDEHGVVKFTAIQSDLLPVLLSLMDDFLYSKEKSFPHVDKGCPSLRFQLCRVSLKLFWHLSCLPITQQQSLISEPVMRRLVTFLDQSKTDIFRYSSSMLKTLNKLISGKTLFAQVKEQGLTSDLIESIQVETSKHCSKVYSSKLPIPETVYRCVLFDTMDPDNDINIAESLINQKLAWPKLTATSPKIKNNQELKDTDIYILHTIHGALFWAHVGEATVYIKSIQRLHNVMSYLLETASVVKKIEIGSKVMVKRLSTDTVPPSVHMYRGVVTAIRGGNCDIFAADLGIILTGIPYSNVYHIPPEVSFNDIPALASLCVLEGIQPPARFPELPQLAAASLVNLCRFSVPAGGILVHSLCGLEILCPLAKCPDRRIAIQVLQTLANLSCNSTLCNCLLQTDIIPQLASILRDARLNIDSDELIVDQIHVCLITLSTLLTISHNARESFYRCDGLTALVTIVATKPPKTIFKAALKLLRIFLWDAPLKAVGTLDERMGQVLRDRNAVSDGEEQRSRSHNRSESSSRRSRSSVTNRTENHPRSLSAGRMDNSCNYRNNTVYQGQLNERHLTGSNGDDQPSDLFFDKHGSTQSRKRSSSPICTKVQAPLSSQYQEEITVQRPELIKSDLSLIMSMGATEDQAKIALQAASNNTDKAAEWLLKNVHMLMKDTEDNTQQTDKGNGSGDGLMPDIHVPVCATSDYKGNNQYYVADDPVDFDHDDSHELRPNLSIKQASTDVISRVICGFLNSGKSGKIVFGIHSDGQVHGVNLTRDERDQFRLGVDRLMMDRLRPAVIHSMYDVTYCPVVRPQGHEHPQTRKPIYDVFIVEISIKKSGGELYTLNTGQCFYRFGPNTVRLNSQEIRQLIVMEEEELCKTEIRKLQSDLETLRQVILDQGT